MSFSGLPRFFLALSLVASATACRPAGFVVPEAQLQPTGPSTGPTGPTNGTGPTGPTSGTGPIGNRAPVAGDVVIGVIEDQTITGTLTATDADGDTLTFTAVTQPSHGTLTLGSDGALSYTPAANFQGSDSFTFKANDGALDSNTATASITVVNEADAIIITNNVNLTTAEDTPITLSLADLAVVDPDGQYPGTFTLIIGTPAGFTVNGLQITPAQDMSGELLVPVRISNGVRTSPSFNVHITVTPVNDGPVIDAQLTTFDVQVDTDTTLSLTDFDYHDVDNDIAVDPGFALLLDPPLPGAHYSRTGTTITPEVGYLGPITVKVRITDGTTVGPVFDALVNMINQTPVLGTPAQNNTPVINEDTSYTILVSDLNYTDPDSTLGELQVRVQPGVGYDVGVDLATVNFHDPHINGTLTVQVALFDGHSTSTAAPFDITVTPVNDAPFITGVSAPTTTAYTTDVQITPAMVTITDVEGDGVGQVVLQLNPGVGGNYTIGGTDTIQPDDDFVGTLKVIVGIIDNGTPSGAASSNTVTIDVEVTNTVATIAQNGSVFAFDEGTQGVITTAFLTITDPDTPQVHNVVVSPPSSGDIYLKINDTTIAAPPHYNGPMTVKLSTFDGDPSNEIDFNVTVNAVNDPPTIVERAPRDAALGGTVTLSLGDVIVTDPDLFDTVPDTYQFFVTDPDSTPANGYQISGNDVITNPIAGPITVSVYVIDQGGTGITSAPTDITINVGNQTPVIGQPSTTPTVDEDLPHLLSTATDIGPGPYDADLGQTYRLEAMDDPAPIATYVVTGSNNEFIQNAVLDSHAPITVRLRLWDGFTYSAPIDVVFNINPTNDAPTITSHVSRSAHIGSIVDFAIDVDAVGADIDGDTPLYFVIDDNSAGNHYTKLSDTQIQLEGGYGAADISVEFHIEDRAIGGLPSAPDFITLTPLNHTPVISAGAAALAFDEGTSFTFATTDVDIDDDTSDFGQTYTIRVLPDLGNTYLVDGTDNKKITQVDPESNAPLSVRVVVFDGIIDSNILTVTVNVTPQNDPPVIDSTVTRDANIGNTVTFVLGVDIFAHDIDSTDTVHLVIDDSSGTNHYSKLSDTSIQLDSGYDVADVIVDFHVEDSSNTPSVLPGQITVHLLNHRPTPIALSSTASMNEGGGFTVVSGTHVGCDDAPDVGQPCNVTVEAGTGYTIDPDNVTIHQIDPDSNTALSLNVRVSDGLLPSLATVALPLSITPVDDKPIIDSTVAVSAHIGTDVTFALNLDIFAHDPDTGDTISLVIDDNSPSNHYTKLTATSIRLEPGYGTADVSVEFHIEDAAAPTSDPGFITVHLLNHTPAITEQLPIPNVDEGSVFTLALSQIVNDDDTIDIGQTYTIRALDDLGSTYTVNPADRTKVSQVDPDSNAQLHIRVVVNDGIIDSNELDLVVNVNPVNDAPVGVDKTGATTSANVTLTSGSGLLVGATDVENDTIQAKAETVASTAGGTAVIAANGTYVFNPLPGFVGTDTFTYKLVDNGTPTPATSTGNTVSVVVSGPVVWFVDSNNATAGTGLDTNPFKALDSAATASATNSEIRITSRVAPYTLTSTFTMDANQTITATGGTPTISFATGAAFTAGSGTGSISGLAITAATGVSASSASAFTISSSTLTTTTAGVNAASVAALTLDGVTLTANGGAALQQSGTTVTTVRSSSITAPTGAGIVATAGTTLNVTAPGGSVTATSVSANGGKVLDLTSTTVNATFSSVTSNAAAGGIKLTSVGGTINATTTTLQNISSNAAFDLTTSTLTSNWGTTTLTGVSGQNGISITNSAGASTTMALGTTSVSSGSVIKTTTAGGTLDITGAAALTSSSRPVLDLINTTVVSKLGTLTSTSSTSDGVKLTSMAAAFSAGNVSITSPTNAGLNVATNAQNVTLDKLDVTGGTAGIALASSTGTLTVGPTTGSAPAGGLIQTGTNGVVFTGTASNLTLRRVRMLSQTNNGVLAAGGVTLGTLSFDSCEFTTPGSLATHHAINFGDASSPSAVTGGAVTFLNNTFTVSNRHAMALYLQGTSGLTLTGNTFNLSLASTAVLARTLNNTGTTAFTLTATSNLVSGGTATGNAFDIASAGTTSNTSNLTTTFNTNAFNWSSGGGSDAISVVAQKPGTIGLTATSNTQQFGDRGLVAIANDGALMTVTANGNNFGDATHRLSGDGFFIQLDPNNGTTRSFADIALTNNTIATDVGVGIDIYAVRGTNAATQRARAVLTNNNVGSTGFDGVDLVQRNNTDLCVELASNTASGDFATGSLDFYLEGNSHFVSRGSTGNVTTNLTATNTAVHGAGAVFETGVTANSAACASP